MNDEDVLLVLIADDELLARKRLTRLLGELSGFVKAGECSSGREVLERVELGDVDIVLLDIQMPGMDGLETRRQMQEESGPEVIFTTAHPEHALRAFEVGALDYVLKPVEAGRLEQALLRAQRRILTKATTPDAHPRSSPVALDRLALPTSRGVRLVDPASVTHASYDGHLVTVHLDGQEPVLTDRTLQELSSDLDPSVFERVHRRSILNLQRVERLLPLDTGGYVAITQSGAEVDVSRQAARRLRRRLGLR